MQTGLKFYFTVEHRMSWHTAQLKVLLMKIIQNYFIAKINSMQLVSAPNVMLLFLCSVFNSKSKGITFSHIQDTLTCSLKQLCPRISIICYPSPLGTVLHSVRGLTDSSIPSSLCSHDPFANIFEGPAN